MCCTFDFLVIHSLTGTLRHCYLKTSIFSLYCKFLTRSTTVCGARREIDSLQQANEADWPARARGSRCVERCKSRRPSSLPVRPTCAGGWRAERGSVQQTAEADWLTRARISRCKNRPKLGHFRKCWSLYSLCSKLRRCWDIYYSPFSLHPVPYSVPVFLIVTILRNSVTLKTISNHLVSLRWLRHSIRRVRAIF
jgi:hypothetical protein